MLDTALAIPEHMLINWQHTVDVMADVFDVPAGLIMRVKPGQLEVLVAARKEGSPYRVLDTVELNTGLYCESVMDTRDLLHVPNALNDVQWKNNPDVSLDMIAYLGVPLLTPDRHVFGTICVLDNKARLFHDKYIELMWEIKKGIERDLELMEKQQRLLEQQRQLMYSNAELTSVISRQHTDAARLHQTNEQLNLALTSLTALQTELLKSAKNAALASLVAGMAHELSTPIGNSIMASSTIQDIALTFRGKMLAGLTRSDLRDFCDSVLDGTCLLERNLERAAQLISSFKRVAVQPAGMTPSRFTLRQIVATVAATVTGVRIVNSVPAELTMIGYLDALSDVMSELLGNAARHAFAGRSPGIVTVAARILDTDCIELTVSDDGVGIAPADQERVFDPFFTTQLGQGGSGLGLHTAYNLVSTVMHGSIELTSAPGSGSRFSITVPQMAL